MKVTICIGSACHLKGSRSVIEQLQRLLASHGLTDKVNLTGAFCSGNCGCGVHVTIDEDVYFLNPDDTENFFKNEILGRI